MAAGALIGACDVGLALDVSEFEAFFTDFEEVCREFQNALGGELVGVTPDE